MTEAIRSVDRGLIKPMNNESCLNLETALFLFDKIKTALHLQIMEQM